jgi:hypothetical protein
MIKRELSDDIIEATEASLGDIVRLLSNFNKG